MLTGGLGITEPGGIGLSKGETIFE